MHRCDKCGYRHDGGRCCIDIYQQLGSSRGPSVAGKVLIAFGLPILVFTVSLVLAENVLSGFMAEDGVSTVTAFLAALVVTAIFVQFIRILTRKDIDTENGKKRK